MPHLKKIWLSEHDDLFTISIRQDREEPWLTVRDLVLPPAEPVDGKRLNIIEAKERGLAERHHTIHFFTSDELVMLRNAIDAALAQPQRSTR